MLEGYRQRHLELSVYHQCHRNMALGTYFTNNNRTLSSKQKPILQHTRHQATVHMVQSAGR